MDLISQNLYQNLNLPADIFTPVLDSQMPKEWHNTQTSSAQDLCIHQMFEAQVNLTPDAIAVVCGNKQLTYRELNQHANQLAHHLRTLGVRAEVLVGICVERSLEMVVGLLGILKAGGAYVPLDPTYPPERLAFILADTQTPVMLTQEKFVLSLPYNEAQVVCLDSDWKLIAQNSQENLVCEATAENLAYVIYTSGSTGQPKGVMIPHCGICNQLNWRQTTFGLTQQDKVLQTISFSFDPSVWQIFWPLSFGAQLIMARPGGHQDSAYLVKTIAELQISVLALVPSILRVLLEEKGIENCQCLKHVTCGGEALPVEIIQRFFACLNLDNVLINCYGPTEASIDATFFPCQRDTVSKIAPIGRPIANTQIYILDEDLQPVPIGEPGELHIGGISLARGYLNRPELTAQKFITNPSTNERLYKTGDLARYMSDGNIEFLGRIDDQVKIRGFRIELGEIETVLDQHWAVQQTLVMAREDVMGDKRLAAYVVPKPEQVPPSVSELRHFLLDKLPEYMVPGVFVFLDALPLSPNGKVDRRALPDISHQSSSNFVAPRTPLEEVLAVIWEQVLGVKQIGINDNFFELGGHSLSATQVISRVSQSFGVELPLQLLFESPTIALVANAIQNQYTGALEYQTIPQLANRQSAELSFAQQRLWFLAQLEPSSTAYHIVEAMQLHGALNVDVLQQSLDAIAAHHEALRTNFITCDGNVVQVISPPRSVELKIIDLKSCQQERTSKVERLLKDEAQRPFNLTTDLMLRACVLQLSSQEHILLLVMHHIATDGWSMGILFEQLTTFYQAFINNLPSSLPELPIQYADYAVWQRQWFSGELQQQQINYWKQQLADVSPVLELPTDGPRPPVQTYRGAKQYFLLPESLSASLDTLSRQEGVTLFMTLLAAFQILLYRYSGQQDILIGSPIAGRNRQELEGLIGFFVNTLVLRTDLSGNPSFQELLQRVRKVAMSAYAHQDLPFDKLVEQLQPERSRSYHPLFQVMFVLQNVPKQTFNLPNLTLTPFDLEQTTSKFDLTLSMVQTKQGLQGAWEYNTDLFDDATITRMNEHFQTLLTGIVTNPQLPVSELPLLTPTERQTLLWEWNKTHTEYQKDKCIHELFEEQVEKTPDAVAVTFKDQQITYLELNNRANQLAHHLQALGVAPEVLVGLCFERSIEMIVGLLGILKAGGAYVPFAPTYPQERITYMLADSQVKMLLTQEKLVAQLPEYIPTICLDTDWAKNATESKENPLSKAHSENLAYVIYTSGSTGKPKGVAIQHHSVINLLQGLEQAIYAPEQNSQLRFSVNGPLAFDTSVKQVIQLLHGHTLDIVPEEIRLDGNALLSYLRHRQVDVLDCTPSQLGLLLSAGLLDGIAAPKYVLLGGEPIDESTWQSLAQAKSINFYNVYGPTECTVDATIYNLQLSPSKPIIGRPIANTHIYILDSHLQPVPIGIGGEVHIGGVGLARGYLNRPDLTQEKFIPNPFSNDKSARLYKTGDRARYLPNGNIEYLGRIDNQVKIRGFRIELGEIESALSQHPDVLQTVVIAREDVPGDKRLVAYIVPKENAPTVGDLRSFLSEKLPEYMVPRAFVLLSSLPLTANGKVNIRALSAPLTILEPEATIPPRNDLEFQLTEIWSEILGVKSIGVTDNFFDLGGHSLLAVKLFAQIEQKFRVQLPLATLFSSGTVEALAKMLGEQTEKLSAGDQQSWSSLVAIQPKGSQPPLFCIHPLGGEILCYRNLALHLGLNQPVYGLQPKGLDGREAPLNRVEEMAALYIQEIQTIQPNGPYYLSGYSLGGIIAYEMAQQLQRLGQTVRFLGIIDTGLRGSRSRSPLMQRMLIHIKNLVQLGPAYLSRKLVGWSQHSKYHLREKYINLLGMETLPEGDKHINIMDSNLEALNAYSVSAYSGKIILLRTDYNSQDSLDIAVGLQSDPLLGWNNVVTGGIDIHYIPGSHTTLFNEPHVRVLADKLKQCLEEA